MHIKVHEIEHEVSKQTELPSEVDPKMHFLRTYNDWNSSRLASGVKMLYSCTTYKQKSITITLSRTARFLITLASAWLR